MRVLTLCYEYPPIGGGGSRVVEGLCRELVRAGDTVELVTMRYDGLPRTEVTADGVRVHRIPCLRRSKHYCTTPEALTYLISAGLRIRAIAREFRPDVVHAHFILPDGVLASRAAAATGVPYVITAHGTDVPGYNPHRARLAHRIAGPLWRRVGAKAATIVCPSESLRALVLGADPTFHTTVIPNGIDPDRFEPAAKRPRILMVTRMLERKGLQYVLQAARDLDLDWTIEIVGDGPYLPVLREMAAGSRVPVNFWGWMENDDERLRELYETSSIFALPSESENFPVCLLEAMAARNAIITTKGTGCAEVVGDAAALVEPHDAPAIREALIDLTANTKRRDALACAARERLVTRFGWPSVARAYRELFGSVVP
jgi:glycosyltransferase involved in cell wall biosynthesis